MDSMDSNRVKNKWIDFNKLKPNFHEIVFGKLGDIGDVGDVGVRVLKFVVDEEGNEAWIDPYEFNETGEFIYGVRYWSKLGSV